MPRPARVHTAMRFEPELLERLRVEADARGVSINWMVTRAVERFLSDLLPVEEIVLTRSQMLAREERP